MKANVHMYTHIHIMDDRARAQLSNAHTNLRRKKKKKDRRCRETVSHKNTETLRVHDKITRAGKWRDPRSREKERRAEGEGGHDRRGAIYTCQSRMFLRIGEARSSIVAHVSCPIVPSIAATHEIALCMHTHMDNTSAHVARATPGLPACTIQTGVV